jgi:hypothetical protein
MCLPGNNLLSCCWLGIVVFWCGEEVLMEVRQGRWNYLWFYLCLYLFACLPRHKRWVSSRPLGVWFSYF